MNTTSDLMETNQSSIVALAASWDASAGVKVAVTPEQHGIPDINKLSMQLFRSFIALGKPHEKLARVYLSFPYYSWYTRSVLHIVGDSWKDNHIRGVYRPCYVAFLMTTELERSIHDVIHDLLTHTIESFRMEQDRFCLLSTLQKNFAQLIQEYCERK